METTLQKNTRIFQPTAKEPQIGKPCRFGLVPSDSDIIDAYEAAVTAGSSYAQKALICGQLLSEKKTSLGHGQWDKWLADNFADAASRTVRRWMAAAERTVMVLSISSVIDIQSETISSVLTLPEAELSDKGREARQLFLDFTADKTIADCLRDVMDGSSPDHRIARAANGKKKGGHLGEDRKDFPKFIQDNLKCLTAHLKHWKIFTGPQAESAHDHLKRAVCKWPDAILESLKKEITEELKRR